MLRSLRTRHRSALLAVGVAAALAAPASASALTVSAAASLRDVLPKIDGSPTYNFAGSDALALQIRNGAPADVFLSANLSIPTQLYKDGLCTKPRVFATNVVVIIVADGQPGRHQERLRPRPRRAQAPGHRLRDGADRHLHAPGARPTSASRGPCASTPSAPESQRDLRSLPRSRSASPTPASST